MTIRTPNEVDDIIPICPDKVVPDQEDPVDTYTHIKDSVYKNERTGMWETLDYPPPTVRRRAGVGALALLAAALAGCAQFENRVACTVDGKRAFFVSEYYRVGVAAQISAADAAGICGVRP